MGKPDFAVEIIGEEKNEKFECGSWLELLPKIHKILHWKMSTTQMKLLYITRKICKIVKNRIIFMLLEYGWTSKSKNLCCFMHVKKLPFTYHANHNAWTTHF